jgi:hypothetical protein
MAFFEPDFLFPDCVGVRRCRLRPDIFSQPQKSLLRTSPPNRTQACFSQRRRLGASGLAVVDVNVSIDVISSASFSALLLKFCHKKPENQVAISNKNYEKREIREKGISFLFCEFSEFRS